MSDGRSLVKSGLLATAARCGPVRNALLRMLPLQQAWLTKPDLWDRQYAAGGWAWLNSDSERVHNHIIAACCGRRGAEAAILDVGCGEGVLHGILRGLGYGRYVGIDVAPTAIDRVASRTDARTRFQVADARSFETAERFDIVVLNEVLYCFPDPPAVARHLSRLLATTGCLIVSMAESGLRESLRNQKIWNDIGCGPQPIDDDILLRTAGVSRQIRILRPLA
jgi:2-polyprenyl-3-methyl-5-hydroxy-6-metoxy-1,4-benzoquinol methylase